MNAEIIATSLNIGYALFAASAVAFVLLGARNLRATPVGTIRVRVPVKYDAMTIFKEKLSKAVKSGGRFAALAPRQLGNSPILSAAAADVAVANLEILLRSMIVDGHPTPHLFGLNKGGYLVANFLLHRLELDQKFLVKCDYRFKPYERLDLEFRSIEGPIILIDDVVRTGNTISKAKLEIQARYPHCAVYAICLVRFVSDEEIEIGSSGLDYFSSVTSAKMIRMPWQKAVNSDHTKFFDDLEIAQLVGLPIALPAPADGGDPESPEKQETIRS